MQTIESEHLSSLHHTSFPFNFFLLSSFFLFSWLIKLPFLSFISLLSFFVWRNGRREGSSWSNWYPVHSRPFFTFFLLTRSRKKKEEFKQRGKTCSFFLHFDKKKWRGRKKKRKERENGNFTGVPLLTAFPSLLLFFPYLTLSIVAVPLFSSSLSSCHSLSERERERIREGREGALYLGQRK